MSQVATGQAKVEAMLSVVKAYMLSIPEGMDYDVYTAFAYVAHGSLFGELLRGEKEAGLTITETLKDREAIFASWIQTSIEYAVELKTGRRANVVEKSQPLPDTPAAADGCTCNREWSAWARKGVVPWR